MKGFLPCGATVPIAVLLLVVTQSCNARVVGKQQVHQLGEQDMESEEVEMVYDSEDSEEVEMVSAFVLEASGKISFGRPQPNATRRKEKGRQEGNPARAKEQSRSVPDVNKFSAAASTAMFFLGAPFMLIALVHLLAAVYEEKEADGDGGSKTKSKAIQSEKANSRHALKNVKYRTSAARSDVFPNNDTTLWHKHKANSQEGGADGGSKRKTIQTKTIDSKNMNSRHELTNVKYEIARADGCPSNDTAPWHINKANSQEGGADGGSSWNTIQSKTIDLRHEHKHVKSRTDACTSDNVALTHKTANIESLTSAATSKVSAHEECTAGKDASNAEVDCSLPNSHIADEKLYGQRTTEAWADMSDSEMDFNEPCFFDDEQEDVPLKTASNTDCVEHEQYINPTMISQTTLTHLATSTLHQQILDHAISVSTELRAQHHRRAEAIQVIRAAASQRWPQASVHVYGSMYGPVASQLALPSSDIDVVVCGLLPRSPQCTDAMILEKMMEFLSHQPQHRSDQSHIVRVQGRSVLRLDKGQLSVDVTVDDTRHSGLRTSEFVRQATENLPLLRPLVLVVKRLLHFHGLSDPFTGGLSGYAVVLLTMRFLLDCSEKQTSQDLGNLLGDMFHFLGSLFVPHKMGVRVRPGESYILCKDFASCPWAFQPLFIEDPENRGSNVGATAWSFPQVQRVFADASAVLKAGSKLDALWT
jgi:non-canonical poly(A) RNA polymerase PAPD5/7